MATLTRIRKVSAGGDADGCQKWIQYQTTSFRHKRRIIGGSGRYERKNTKATVGSDRALDVRRWQRDRLLKPRWRFDWQWPQDGPAAGVAVRVEERQVVLAYRCEWGDGSQAYREYPGGAASCREGANSPSPDCPRG